MYIHVEKQSLSVLLQEADDDCHQKVMKSVL